jgi:5-methylcytosine-specific restriction endonuclease McrA
VAPRGAGMSKKRREPDAGWAWKPDGHTVTVQKELSTQELLKRQARRERRRLLKKICKENLRKAKAQKRARHQDEEFYKSWEWAKLRYEVLNFYGRVCMCCGSTHKIVVDHIKPRSKFPEFEMSFDNLQVLCNLCNKGKSNTDYTDFRPPEISSQNMNHVKSITEMH